MEDEHGNTVLGLAVGYGQRECIDILLAGASPIALCGDDGGSTVLHVMAMARGGVPALKRLISVKGTGEGGFDLAWLELRNL